MSPTKLKRDKWAVLDKLNEEFSVSVTVKCNISRGSRCHYLPIIRYLLKRERMNWYTEKMVVSSLWYTVHLHTVLSGVEWTHVWCTVYIHEGEEYNYISDNKPLKQHKYRKMMPSNFVQDVLFILMLVTSDSWQVWREGVSGVCVEFSRV